MSLPVLGRPLKFQSVEILDAMIAEYFNVTPKDEWTWTGLALHLKTDKETLTSYKDREEFTDSIKNAMLKVENGYEIDLKKHGRTGSIFALKNFNWKDKTETDNKTEQKIFVITEDNGTSENKPLESTRETEGNS